MFEVGERGYYVSVHVFADREKEKSMCMRTCVCRERERERERIIFLSYIQYTNTQNLITDMPSALII